MTSTMKMRLATALALFAFGCNGGLLGGAGDTGSYTDDDLPAPSAGTIVADHARTDASAIPAGSLERARTQLRVFYGHTSHGSQIISGMEAMNSSPYTFHLGADAVAGSLSVVEDSDNDLGHMGDLGWRDMTVAMLNEAGNDRNVVVWSWCGGVSDNTEAGIATYLAAMNQLEQDYPNVTFVYMTGHLDGTGAGGRLHRRNNQIRQYCYEHGKVLFDFGDIERYDPDGVDYLDLGADDECNYRGGNWAEQWCSRNLGQCSSCECAHSESLNCDLKARAFWWLLAQIAERRAAGD